MKVTVSIQLHIRKKGSSIFLKYKKGKEVLNSDYCPRPMRFRGAADAGNMTYAMVSTMLPK